MITTPGHTARRTKHGLPERFAELLMDCKFELSRNLQGGTERPVGGGAFLGIKLQFWPLTLIAGRLEIMVPPRRLHKLPSL